MTEKRPYEKMKFDTQDNARSLRLYFEYAANLGRILVNISLCYIKSRNGFDNVF